MGGLEVFRTMLGEAGSGLVYWKVSLVPYIPNQSVILRLPRSNFTEKAQDTLPLQLGTPGEEEVSVGGGPPPAQLTKRETCK